MTIEFQDVEGEDTMANLTTTFAGIFGKANLKWTPVNLELVVVLSIYLIHCKRIQHLCSFIQNRKRRKIRQDGHLPQKQVMQ